MKTETIELARDSGRVFDGFLAAPDAGRKPAIMILPEMFGVNRAMQGVARHYAEQGHCVLIPNLFWQTRYPEPLDYDEAGFEKSWIRVRDLDYDRAAADMRLAAAALRAQPSCNGKVAALGFCIGGRLAYLAAARSGVDAAIALYALGISNYLGEADAVRVPLQLHYGDKDVHVPAEEVEKVAKGVAGRPNVTLYRYDAGHSFFNKVRPTYDAAAAALAAERIGGLLAAI